MKAAVKPFGWLGDYEGFQVKQSRLVKSSLKPYEPVAACETVLAPADISVRCKLYWSPAFCLVVPDQLDYERLVDATAQLISACPVIAGRCALSFLMGNSRTVR